MSMLFHVELGNRSYPTKTFVIEAKDPLDALSMARDFLADKLEEIYFANQIPLDIPLDVLTLRCHETRAVVYTEETGLFQER